ncbi:negative elongation factor A-like [Diadema setosum]|uniref:negative elongation factor A-like n=1 Tax=Diadema setosum TaxID=31175 RepID=UPI003B3ACD85
MATVRDSDTSLWLNNKLGDNDDLWSGITSISTQLHRDVLRNTHDCFQNLQPTVKLKLLMAILHMPRRNVEECKEELSAILHSALTDTDEWVATVADILRSYPVSGQLNLELEESHPFLAEALHELRRTLAITDSNSLLPMECLYLNKNALNQLVGMQAPPVKHFTLKRKPKSAALRAELLQKSLDAQQQQKKPITPTPNSKIRGGFRGMNDVPLRGIPKATPGFRSSQSPGFTRSMPLNRNHSRMTMNREGGTKLLDIKEQPIGGSSREAKRRKKQAEQEAQEQAKKEKEAAMQQTPDYAAALMSPAVHKPPTTTAAPAVTQPQTPSYVPTVALSKPTTPTPTLLGSLSQPAPSSATLAARENLTQQLHQSLQQQTTFRAPSAAGAAPATTTSQTPTTPAASPATTTTAAAPAAAAAQNPYGAPSALGAPSGTEGASQAPPPYPAPSMVPAVQQPPAGPKKNLSLTKDQMRSAQEMFRQSNKVTRPEKALILGFMAGARENPCPQQGDVVTIRLSEDVEVLHEQTMAVGTFFEMNYATGEWKRYKKYKPLQSS